MKIKLNDTIEYDDLKGINEQSKEVKIFLLPYIDALNTQNCTKADKYGRPTDWVVALENKVKITYTRSYKTVDKIKSVEFHKIKIN